MKWDNLKNYKCPKCGDTLREHYPAIETNNCATLKQHVCTDCDFKIGDEKFTKIVNQKYQPRKCVTFEENMGALNNLDRPEVTEDFSDSPHLDK